MPRTTRICPEPGFGQADRAHPQVRRAGIPGGSRSNVTVPSAVSCEGLRRPGPTGGDRVAPGGQCGTRFEPAGQTLPRTPRLRAARTRRAGDVARVTATAIVRCPCGLQCTARHGSRLRDRLTPWPPALAERRAWYRPWALAGVSCTRLTGRTRRDARPSCLTDPSMSTPGSARPGAARCWTGGPARHTQRPGRTRSMRAPHRLRRLRRRLRPNS